MDNPTCSNRGCDRPATAVYVSTGNIRIPEVRYPRCDRHPLGNATRVEPLADPPPQPDPSPLTTDADVDDTLLRRLQEAEVTDRHLRAMSSGKQAARAAGEAPWTQRLSMVEAIIVWWEQEVRGEVLGGDAEPVEVEALEIIEGVIYSHEEGTGTALEIEELLTVRRALRARVQADPVEGDGWSVYLEDRVAMEDAYERQRVSNIIGGGAEVDPMFCAGLVLRDRLRARVQPRKVSDDLTAAEFEDAWHAYCEHGWAEARRLLGLQIEGEDDR